MFDALNDWAGKECKRKELPDTPQNRRLMLGDSLGKVRFLTLSVTELAEGPIKSGVLTNDESLALLLRLVSGQGPVPSGFSTETEPRCLNHFSTDCCVRRKNFQLNFDLLSLCPGYVQYLYRKNASKEEHYCPIMFNKERRVSFVAGRNLCLCSVVLATQIVDISAWKRMNPNRDYHEYEEEIAVYIRDEDDEQVSCGSFMGSTQWSSSVNIQLDPPVCIEKLKHYVVQINLKKFGWYHLRDLVKEEPPFYRIGENSDHDNGFLVGFGFF